MHPAPFIGLLETLQGPLPLPDVTQWKNTPEPTFRMVANVISVFKVVKYLWAQVERDEAVSFEEKLARRLDCEEAGEKLLHLVEHLDDLTPASRQLVILLCDEVKGKQ